MEDIRDSLALIAEYVQDLDYESWKKEGVEFDSFKHQAGSNSFTLSPNKWIETTRAIGIKSAAIGAE